MNFTRQEEALVFALEALREIAEIADDRADADQPTGALRPIPNDWMRVLVLATDALKRAGVES